MFAKIHKHASRGSRRRDTDRPMSSLEQTWRAWRGLSRADRARFLSLLREAYSRERQATVAANGGTRGATVSSLGELALTGADLQRLRP
ncbi:hypothetical protein AS156_14290 [Bradyrhizobium macuxiense]|uniref:Uncharacterized protein n=1 Tax=Bradyrhizobium macuxiense TaxID=1755647 RepID=A0A109JKA9_9BRAD|nr:hypothetical protein AS156_14290 [Bradyrhizobium macuxiense]